jgi:hypothetical protein
MLVIGFLSFTRLPDGTCADNAERFYFARLVKRLTIRSYPHEPRHQMRQLDTVPKADQR